MLDQIQLKDTTKYQETRIDAMTRGLFQAEIMRATYGTQKPTVDQELSWANLYSWAVHNIIDNPEYKEIRDLLQKKKFGEAVALVMPMLEALTSLMKAMVGESATSVEQIAWMERIRALGRTFKIIHVSDECGKDPIHFYSWPEVTGVMRTYSRPDLPTDPKILVVPLGYHWQFRGNVDIPHISTPELPFRDMVWSFAGTDWHSRKSNMNILQSI